MTVNEWLDIWLKDYQIGVKDSTAYLYERQAKLYLRPALGNIPLLMTFRTSKEGGEKAIEPAAYAELNIKAAQKPT